MRLAAAVALLTWVPARPSGDSVGAAKVDVTPEFPVRLCGYAARDQEPVGVAQKLYARALAVGDGEQLALVESVDNCAVPASIVEEVARRLHDKRGLARERFTLASTHTHTGPWLEGSIECMFGRPVPSEQLERVHRYTTWFVDRVEQAALAAIDARAPATLSWAEGRAHFATNRRTANGPTDPALPLLIARGLDGSVKAVVQSYACHCTTCGPALNQDCGDWAGYASELVESAHPGCVALTLLGCAGDQNPSPGMTTKLQDCVDHGRAIAGEVERLLASGAADAAGPARARPLHVADLVCKLERIDLSFDKLPTRDELLERAKRNDPVAYNARRWLEKLDRGETMPNTLPYVVQSWSWGDQLVQLFLAGEVVVDYSLRLKREFDRARLWVSAYSNDVPCYIPSRRVLREGGYEAEGAMTYYGRPTRLAPAVEEAIVDAVKRIVPASFVSDEQSTRFPPPKLPGESLACIDLSRDDLRVELVASEPAIQSPVAIDFGPDGTVWVCEMNDYPTGMDGRYQPGGRIVCLKDRDGDGKYESSTVFLDGLPFPTGVMAWRRGVLICAAPDILYAEDTDGDGKADVKRVLFTGFSTENYQARVNSLTWGLDGWVYGSCGLFGGVITPKREKGDGEPVDCRGRDFRIDPDHGVIEPVEGTSQQGRVRDDFGRWFGCDNSCLLFQFPLADRYVKRNPFVAAHDPRWNVLDGGSEDPRELFQVSPKLERFNDQNDASRVTAACGVTIYRDKLLGSGLYGNAFTCEPVSNVVRRTVLTRAKNEVVLRGRRAPEETHREFLASSDPWFRPVQATTGPDGALWIVDMYRFVIEHPRWIPAAKLAELDVRAGSEMGRIYRVVPTGAPLRKVTDLTNLTREQLEAAFETENGVVRDLVHRELVQRTWPPEPEPANETLEERVRRIVDRKRRTHFGSSNPVVELHRAWLDESLGSLDKDDPLALLDDEWPPEVRADAIARCERHFLDSPRLAEFVAATGVQDPAWQMARKGVGEVDALLAFQAALSLGEWHRPAAGEALGEMLTHHPDDEWVRAALLSSATEHCDALIARALELEARTAGDESAATGVHRIVEQLVTTAGRLPIERTHEKLHVMDAIAGHDDAAIRQTWRWRALARLMQGIESDRQLHTNLGWIDSCRESDPRHLSRQGRDLEQRVVVTFFDAARAALAAEPPDPDAVSAGLELMVLEHAPDDLECPFAGDAKLLRSAARFLDPSRPVELGLAALAAMRRSARFDVPDLVLAALSRATPAIRAAALDVLLARREWSEALVDAVESGKLAKSCFDALHRDRLLRSEDVALREQATKLLAPSGTPKRAAVLEQFKPALDLKGDPAKGRATFAKLCASCHFFRGQGHDLAPDLAALGDRSPARLLESILDPNAAVAAEYVAYDVETKSGDSWSGLLRGETSSGFTLVQANDVRHELLRSDVASVRASKLSLMPEGLEEGLVAQDLADLIEHLRRGPPPLRDVAPDAAAAARAELKQQGMNGYAKLVSEFDVFSQPSWLGPCTMHYCRQSDGTGRVKWLTQPARAEDVETPKERPRVLHFRFAAALGFLSQPKGEFTLALDGKPLLRFDVATDDAHWSSGDGRAELDFDCRAANREDATGVMTLTVPAELVELGKSCELEVVGSAAGSQRWFGVLAPDE
jgi:putative membrane-bound dehydrogenase-like protein